MIDLTSVIGVSEVSLSVQGIARAILLLYIVCHAAVVCVTLFKFTIYAPVALVEVWDSSRSIATAFRYASAATMKSTYTGAGLRLRLSLIYGDLMECLSLTLSGNAGPNMKTWRG